MLQNAFQGFFVTAEKARLGLYVTIIAGLGNVLFDALFVVVFQWGLVGAAIATAANQFIGGLIPILYFSRKNDSLLRLGKTKFNGKVFAKVCANGMSEFFTNICLSAVAILYNAQLMKIVGISGVSAYGVMQYIGFIFIAVFLGYAVGCAPIIGYQYGAKNHKELKNVFLKSLFVSAMGGVCMTLIACLLSRPLSAIFVGGDKELLDMTASGMYLYSLCFLGAGLNIFASAFFTALSNGGVSLLISFFRTFLCQAAAVLVLPNLLGLALNGVWLSAFVAEIITLLLTTLMFLGQRKRYRYM